jgi:ABC-type spermidine/putrescine transport system permease subunit II
LPGIVLGVRFLIAYAAGQGDGHVQSLILASILIVTAVVIYVSGIITDLISANRVLLEDVRMRLLRAEIDPAHRRQPG